MNEWAEVVKRWGESDFDACCKRAIKATDPRRLPLQQGLTQGSHALDEGIEAVILHKQLAGDSLKIKAGIFYKSVIAGCSCADDPTPIDELSEYCELEFVIDRATGEMRVGLV